MNDKEKLKEHIRKNYPKVAQKGATGGCCSSGCCGNAMDVKKASENLGYSIADLSDVPNESNMGLGCGNPLAIASLKEGEVVLDLGCGGGFDCFLSRKKVGKSGYVIGVDMTPEMVKLARSNLKSTGFDNVDFRLGEIEHLPVADLSIDVIISNCVINLSLDKEMVFKEAYRVLKKGGRLAISDIVTTSDLPDIIKQDIKMLCGCISGAEHVETIKSMLIKTGFNEVKLRQKDNSREIISSWIPDKKIEDLVASYIIEAIK